VGGTAEPNVAAVPADVGFAPKADTNYRLEFMAWAEGGTTFRIGTRNGPGGTDQVWRQSGITAAATPTLVVFDFNSDTLLDTSGEFHGNSIIEISQMGSSADPVWTLQMSNFKISELGELCNTCGANGCSGCTARVIYNMQNDQRLVAEAVTGNFGTDFDWLTANFGGAEGSSISITNSPTTIRSLSRNGTSQGVGVKPTSFTARANHRYGFEFTGSFAGSGVRLMSNTALSGGTNTDVAVAPATGGNFTLLHRVDAAAMAGIAVYRLGSAAGTGETNITYTNIRVISYCPPGCNDCGDGSGAVTTVAVTTGNEPATTDSGGNGTEPPPITTPGPIENNDGRQVQLIAMGNGDWNIHRSNSLTIANNQQYTLDLTLPSQEAILQLAIRSAGATFEHPAGFANAVQAPTAWWSGEDVPQILINSISINGTTLPAPNARDNNNLVQQYYPAQDGFIVIDLYNAWDLPSILNSINPVTVPTDGGPVQGFNNGAPVTSISVTFTISNIGGGGTSTTIGSVTTSAATPPITTASITTHNIGGTTPPPSTPASGQTGEDPVANLPLAPAGQGARVQMMAREAVDFGTGYYEAGAWKGQEFTINGDGTYHARVDITGNYSSIVQFGIYSVGSEFEETLEIVNAISPTHFWDAMVWIEKVTANHGAIDLGANFVDDNGNENGLGLIVQGWYVADGFVYFDLWNGWWEPSQRLTNVSRPTGVHNSFGLPGGGQITSLEITFRVEGTPYRHDKHPQEAGNERRGGGIVFPVSPGTAGSGAITSGTPSITCVLQILLRLAGLPNDITPALLPAALITPESKQSGQPGITDVLQILLWLARLDNMIGSVYP
jgi:hypothetical protein